MLAAAFFASLILAEIPEPPPAEIKIGETKLDEAGRAVAMLFREVEKGTLAIKELHLLQRIAKAESDKRQHDWRGEVLRGKFNRRDIGYFQINEIHHGLRAAALGFDIYTLEGNVGYAIWLFKNEGAKPWNWSIGGWRK